MEKRFIFIIFIILLHSCSKLTTIGLKSHRLGRKPRHIVWLQIAGLKSEHLASLRFFLADARDTTSLENHICLGEAWNFNLFKIRPMANEGFLSQITGSKNIKGTCSDYSLNPVWNYLAEIGFNSLIFEATASPKESIIPSKECYQQKRDFYKNVAILQMSDRFEKEGRPFQYQQKQDFPMGHIYYDKSCQKNNCQSSLSNNIKSLWPREKRTFLIIRDFHYQELLQKKNINKAINRLKELADIHSYLSHWGKKKNDTLLIVSSSSARNIEFPRQGKDWSKFQQRGKGVIYRRSSLISPVYATGPGAENFCGMFSQSDFLKRLIYPFDRK